VHRGGRWLALSAVGLLAATAVSPARSVEPSEASRALTSYVPVDTTKPYPFGGTLGDKVGEPIAGQVVTDGVQRSVTTDNGSWWMPEATPDSHQFRVFGNNIYPVSFSASSPSVPGLYGPITDARYTAGIVSWERGPTTAIITAFSGAPRVGVSGTPLNSCLGIIDAETQAGALATPTGQVDASGAVLWRAVVPSTVSRIRIRVSDCGLGVPLTTFPYPSLSYGQVVPPPPAMTTMMQQWFATPNPVVSVPATGDPDKAVIAIDGRALAVGLDLGNFLAQARGLLEGDHVVYFATENSSGWQRLSIDLTAPATGPGAAVGTHDVLLSLSASDQGSGIDTTATRFSITNGITKMTVTPAYDAEAGVLTYTASSLPPGAYTATAVVSDRAGNQTTTSWPFSVSAV
jgi:hypothetical protein